MKRKFGLQTKFTLLFLGFMVLITLAVLLITEYNNEIIIERRFYDYAVSIGSLTAGMVTADEVLYYKDCLEMDENYCVTLAELQKIREKTQIHYLYVIYPISDEQGIYIYDAAIGDDNGNILGEYDHGLGEEVALGKGFDMAWEVMETGQISGQFEYEGGVDIDDMLVSVFVPILNQAGKAVAFVGVDMDIRIILDSISEARDRMLGIMVFLMAACYIVLMLIVRFSIIKPINALKIHAQQISEGNFSETISVRGHDEISEITYVFNRMSKSIQGHMEEVQGINYAYYRYVPSELLDILGKESITQVELGNQANRFAAILTFQLMETGESGLTPDGGQIMEDMNELFRTIVPAVVEQKGFVQSFQNTSMVAVYTEGVKGAVESAISICKNLNGAGGREGKDSPGVSMGIDYGGVLFGIVGHEKRMAAVSISAHAAMAEYLQKLAVQYGAGLLITAGAAEQIKDFHTVYHYRFLGMVENPYNKMVEKVYDIYDGDCEKQREGKERTKEQFERGVELFCMRQFRESRQAFVEVLKRFRGDKASKRYLQYCNQYYQQKSTEDIRIFLRDE